MDKNKSLIYNIPVELFDAYRARRVIVRTFDPQLMIDTLADEYVTNLQYVQILSLSADTSVLMNWNVGMPLDLVMYEPEIEFGKLYQHAALLDKHPVRVTIPVRPGFANAVRVAASLHFAVKINAGQPDRDGVAQMLSTVSMFLHKPSFEQPIEFFQSMLQSLFRDQPMSLWEVQEEDASIHRYVTGQGREIISPRFIDLELPRGTDMDAFVDLFEKQLIFEKRECARCEYLTRCKGYFKWPNKDYICGGGVTRLFNELREAAIELNFDVAEFRQLQQLEKADDR